MKKCVVIIPIYKRVIDKCEMASALQCKNILSQYDIKFICPQTLDVSEYENFADFEFIRFDDKYFESVHSYCALLLNKSFYEKFNDYEYMLLYQLDSWVFKDELSQWCDKGYDYIGAPWFKGFSIAKENAKMRKFAGNGGFSLRKISTFVDMLSTVENSDGKMTSLIDLYTKRGERSKWHISKLPKTIMKYFSKNNTLKLALKNPPDCEDSIIVNDLRHVYPKLKVAEAKDAKAFSFEVLPKRLFEECNNELPFGCHAFKKYNWEFWKKYIECE